MQLAAANANVRHIFAMAQKANLHALNLLMARTLGVKGDHHVDTWTKVQDKLDKEDR
jgi:hypothetical protein